MAFGGIASAFDADGHSYARDIVKVAHELVESHFKVKGDRPIQRDRVVRERGIAQDHDQN
jgi:hypothetical protein